MEFSGFLAGASQLSALAWFLVIKIVPRLAAIAAIYISSICVYRIFFHPLAAFPGPILAKVSNLYAAYHAWRGDVHEDILRCHERYGSRVRYGPDRLLFNTAQSVSDIYSHRANTLKSKVYHALAQQAPNSLTMRDKVLHGRRRRVVSQAFSENTLRSFEPKIVGNIHHLATTIAKTQDNEKGWTSAKDMARCFDHLAFDIMTDVIFSAKYNTISEEKFRYAIQSIEQSNVRLGVLVQAPELSIKAIQKTLFPQAIFARGRLVRFIQKLLAIRLQAKDQKDIFSYIQGAKDPDTGKGLDTMELSTETATMIVAGSDTTSTAMAATLHYLSYSPKAYDRVAEEVRSRFKSLDEIRMGPVLNSCTYLRACIDESLRMSPPGGGPLWREVGPGGTVIDGDTIPAGYDVGVGIHSIHHNPAYFPDPYKFNPTRWIKSEDKSEPKDMHKAYIPFGIGARSCIGKPMALHELMLTLATLFFQFEFRANKRNEKSWESKDMVAQPFLLRDHVTGQKDGPFVEFRQREVTA